MLHSFFLQVLTIKALSIFPAILFLDVINGSTSIGIMVIAGGHPEWINGLTGLTGFIVLGTTNIIIFISTMYTIDDDFEAAFK